MKTSMTRTLWGLAAGLLLWSAPALADRACRRGCDEDARQCKDICKKYAKGMVGKCSEACEDEKRACSEECSGRPAKRKELPQGKEEDHHDDAH